MARLLRPILVVALFAFAGVLAGQSPPGVARSATYTFHGVTIADEYAWLSDLKSPVVTKWVKKQTERTKQHLDRIEDLPALRRWSDSLVDANHFIDDLLHENGVTVAVIDGDLYRFRPWHDLDDIEPIVDAEIYYPGHEAKIALVSLSRDGRRLAVGVSKDGLEEGEVAVYDTLDGERLPDTLTRVITSQGGDLSWLPDGSGFYYSYFPDARPGGRLTPTRYARQEIRFHRLGRQQSDDPLIFGQDLPGHTCLASRTSPDGKRLLICANYGFRSDASEWFVRESDGRVRRVASREDRWTAADFFDNDSLYVQSHAGAPCGKVLLVPSDGGPSRVLVPDSDRMVGDVVKGDSRLFLADRNGRHERLRVFDFAGNEVAQVPVPPYCSVQELTHLNRDRVIYRCEGYVTPPAWWLYDAAERTLKRLAISGEDVAKPDDVEVSVEEAKSADGAMVPLTILRKKGTPRDGERPVVLTAYGGFREVNRPNYDADRRLWLEHDGVWVIAEPRGDGCKGDAWYEAAAGAGKHKTIDDFIAAAEHLVARDYTKPGQIATYGGSNGGLTVAAAFIRKPQLFGAVVIDCGVLDLLRFERDFTGQCYSPEYGSPAMADEFKAMLALSPYHNLKDQVKYPSVWVRTGMNDRRLHPAHSYSFVAKMQHLKPPAKDDDDGSAPGGRVFLSAHPDEGHEFAPSTVEMIAFMFEALSVEPREPPE